MTLQTAIKHQKQRLINKAKNGGLYENFGQAEVSKLCDSFIDVSDYSPEMNEIRSAINDFDEWCMTYEGS